MLSLFQDIVAKVTSGISSGVGSLYILQDLAEIQGALLDAYLAPRLDARYEDERAIRKATSCLADTSPTCLNRPHVVKTTLERALCEKDHRLKRYFEHMQTAVGELNPIDDPNPNDSQKQIANTNAAVGTMGALARAAGGALGMMLAGPVGVPLGAMATGCVAAPIKDSYRTDVAIGQDNVAHQQAQMRDQKSQLYAALSQSLRLGFANLAKRTVKKTLESHGHKAEEVMFMGYQPLLEPLKCSRRYTVLKQLLQHLNSKYVLDTSAQHLQTRAEICTLLARTCRACANELSNERDNSMICGTYEGLATKLDQEASSLREEYSNRTPRIIFNSLLIVSIAVAVCSLLAFTPLPLSVPVGIGLLFVIRKTIPFIGACSHSQKPAEIMAEAVASCGESQQDKAIVEKICRGEKLEPLPKTLMTLPTTWVTLTNTFGKNLKEDPPVVTAEPVAEVCSSSESVVRAKVVKPSSTKPKAWYETLLFFFGETDTFSESGLKGEKLLDLTDTLKSAPQGESEENKDSLKPL